MKFIPTILWLALAADPGHTAGVPPAEPAQAHHPPCGVDMGWYVTTDDGQVVFLHRHAAAGPPVLVVHGISSNHYCWDLDNDRSLGAFLAEAGFDAWLMDLRGHGDARTAPNHPPLRGDWSVDDYALHDVPAALAFVRAQTGVRKVAYVGHSLGGIIGAIHAIRGGDDAVSPLVAVGSPVDFRDADPVFALAGRSFALGGAFFPFFITPTLAQAMDLAAARITAIPEELLYNPDNMERDAARRMMSTVVSPIWRGEMLHFSKMIAEGRFQSADGAVDYGQAMGSIQAPTLVIAGRADRIASADRVKAYHDWVGSPDRRFVVAGRENGFAQDYGHLDLALGDRVREEIYPLILDWLREH